MVKLGNSKRRVSNRIRVVAQRFMTYVMTPFFWIFLVVGFLVTLGINTIMYGEPFPASHPGLFVVFIFTFLTGLRMMPVNRGLIQEFAKKHGWQYGGDMVVPMGEEIPYYFRGTSLRFFNYTANRYFSSIVTGDANGLPFTLTRYSIGDEGAYEYTVLGLILPFWFPRFAVDNQKTHGFSDLIDKNMTQSIRLEGSFGDDFTVHIPPSEGNIERLRTLSVFTPDVMELYQNNFANCCWLSEGGRLIFVTKDDLYTTGQLDDIVAAMREILPKIERQLGLSAGSKESLVDATRRLSEVFVDGSTVPAPKTKPSSDYQLLQAVGIGISLAAGYGMYQFFTKTAYASQFAKRLLAPDSIFFNPYPLIDNWGAIAGMFVACFGIYITLVIHKRLTIAAHPGVSLVDYLRGITLFQYGILAVMAILVGAFVYQQSSYKSVTVNSMYSSQTKAAYDLGQVESLIVSCTVSKERNVSEFHPTIFAHLKNGQDITLWGRLNDGLPTVQSGVINITGLYDVARSHNIRIDTKDEGKCRQMAKGILGTKGMNQFDEIFVVE